MRFNKIYRFACQKLNAKLSNIYTSFIFFINNVNHKDFTSLGIPLIQVHESGSCKLGKGLVMINNQQYSMLGKTNKCKLTVFSNAKLNIGDFVGMSNTIIIASKSITIGNNILMGGGVTIVDTDFHSLNPGHWHTEFDSMNMKSEAIIINDNVFIGMNAVILKGVTIGSNSVIAAGSVVAKNIPENQIWGGNPVQFIKNKSN